MSIMSGTAVSRTENHKYFIGNNVDGYSETIVMHSSFSLLRINGLYMFRALLAHLQKALHKRYLVHCVRAAN
jgi:hypothetical protein